MPTTAAPKPIPTLQPGEYATVPPACKLTSQAAVHPYIPHALSKSTDELHKQEECHWFSDHDIRPDHYTFFQWVITNVSRFDPIKIPGGATATQAAISQLKMHIKSGWHAVPGLGDQAYEGHLRAGDVKLSIFAVQRKNVFIQINCRPSDQKKDTAKVERVCLNLTRQAVTNLDARN